MVGCKREEEILGRLFTDFISPDDRNRASSDVKHMSQNAMMGLSEYHGMRTDGSAIDLEVNGEFILGADGRPTQMVFILRDIADRKQSEKEIQRQLGEKEILLKEVHHRIKNNFASVSGLLSLQAQALADPKAALVLQDAIGRVDSMRILYDKLLLTEDYEDLSVKNYLDDLIDTIIAIFPDHAKITIKKRITDFGLDSKRLFPLGIIINELLTNIMKYAFVNRKTGRIEITLTNVKKHVTLTIQDNGIGLPVGFDIGQSKGFGLMLVKMLSQQLGGSFSMAKHKGTRSTLEFDM
jgi:PAS domain S-box-containing protein